MNEWLGSPWMSISTWVVSGLSLLWRQRLERTDAFNARLAQLIAENRGLSVDQARAVLAGRTSLEKLDTEAWKLAVDSGLDYEAAYQVVSKQVSAEKLLQERRAAYLARQLSAPMKDPFPFRMNPMRPSLHAFDLGEMCQEPAAYINAGVATTWIYQDNDEITHLVLSGHANGPVCRNLTALLMNTYLSMDSLDEALLVPGACMLRGTGGSHQLDFRAPGANINENRLIAQFFQKSPTPLQRLPGDLLPFVKDTGLAQVYGSNGKTYWQLNDEILAAVALWQQNPRPVLLRRCRNDPTPRAVYLPFYLLNGDTVEELSFEMPLSVFESEDFIYLKDVHQRALMLEMTDDAMRRKSIYQEWLHKDETDLERYRVYYNTLIPEVRQAKTVHISGSRDYLTATVQSASQDGKEVYISPEEHLNQNLPALIQNDKFWIGQMDQLMRSINTRDQARDQRLAEVNTATLIDSFLRGWASVFLSGEEGRSRYEKWCREKREAVWQVIRRQLSARQVRIDPLLEENTVFQIQMISESHMRFTPLHLATDDNLLIYLSPRTGLTHYVNLWSRRECEYLPGKEGKSNAAMAKYHYAQAEKWLDMTAASNQGSVPAEQLESAIEALTTALQYHPLVVAQALWKDWWARFARNTASSFQLFKNLMRGIQAYYGDDHEAAQAHLKAFVQQFPTYLPDPYMLLLLIDTERKFQLRRKIQTRQSKAKQYAEWIEDHNRKVEFLNSNQALVRKFYSGSSASQEFFVPDIATSQFDSYIDIQAKVQDLKGKITRIEAEIKELDTEITQIKKLIWSELSKSESEWKRIARTINSNYVNDLIKKEVFELSQDYWLRYRPLLEIMQGDEYIHIAEQLSEATFSLDQNKLSIRDLKDRIYKCLKVEYISIDELAGLKEFYEKLDAFSAQSFDSIIRELMLKKEVEQLAQNYFKKGLELYTQSAYLLPEFTEPVQRLTGLYAQYRLQYRKSLETMTCANIPVRNFAPQAQFTLLEGNTTELTGCRLDTAEGMIIGILPTGSEVLLASVDGLSEEEATHLSSELANPEFLKKPAIGQSAAEKLLNRPIRPSPKSQRWSEAIRRTQSLLIPLIAYAGILPIPSDQPLPREAVQAFEKRRPIRTVRADIDLVQRKFLAELDEVIDKSSVTEF